MILLFSLWERERERTREQDETVKMYTNKDYIIHK